MPSAGTTFFVFAGTPSAGTPKITFDMNTMNKEQGEVIRLLLLDGKPSGRIKCTIANWKGLVYKIPRTLLDKCEGIGFLNNIGVYFLFGTGKDNYDKTTIYVGQAGSRKDGKGLLGRILEPHDSIDWTQVVLLTTSDNSFGPTEICYLENRFYNLARVAARYYVTNGNEPSQGNITEEMKCEMEKITEYVRMIMGSLGHNAFEPLPLQKVEEGTGEIKLRMKYGQGNATGKCTSDGFVVFKGSKIDPETTNSCPKNVKKLREDHKEKIMDNTLIEDIEFSSPSAAASFIGGASLNGRDSWKNDANKSLKDIDLEKNNSVAGDRPSSDQDVN